MPGILYGRRERLLHLDDRQRRHELDEAEEEDEEPGEAADDDRGVRDRRYVDTPGGRVEVVAQGRHDDVEALEPHAYQDEYRHDIKDDGVRPGRLPEQDQRRHAVAEVHGGQCPPVRPGEPPEQRGLLEVIPAVPGRERLADVEVGQTRPVTRMSLAIMSRCRSRMYACRPKKYRM